MASSPNPATQPDESAKEPLKNLPGTWRSCGLGWNMIALPFADKNTEGQLKYRLLLNRYNEILKFSKVGDRIPNRGVVVADAPDKDVVAGGPDRVVEADQFVTALDYEQTIEQSAAADFPESGKAGSIELPIHHEPGLWLHMRNQRTGDLNIARLATIPHGDSVLALGRSLKLDPKELFQIPEISGLPIWKLPSDPNQSPGISNDVKKLLLRREKFPLPEPLPKLVKRLGEAGFKLEEFLDDPYLKPYGRFHGKQKFEGIFTPVNPNHLLNEANKGVSFKSITKLHVDTEVELPDKKIVGGIIDIPFITKRADATRMTSTFWIQEIEGLSGPELRLQYTQTVLLDFAGFVWPHVSINTLKKDCM